MIKFFRETAIPAMMFASAVIGAGMFSLPQIFARSGVAVGIAYLILIGIVVSLIHKKYTEITEVEGDDKRFPEYAEKYLGEGGKVLGSITSIIGIIFSLTIYVALSGSFISAIFPALPETAGAIMFFVAASLFISAGITSFAALDSILFGLIAIIVFAIAITGAMKGDFSAVTSKIIDPVNILLPLGPVLFALNGRAAISSIKEYFRKKGYDKKNLSKAIVIGTIVPAVFYGLFSLGIIALSGSGISADAVSGISHMPYWFIAGFAFLGVITLITSYIFLGLELKDILQRKFHSGKILAFILSAGIPLALYLSGMNNFEMLIGIAGGIFIALEMIMIVFMYRVMTGKKKATDIILIGIGFSGIIYEISRLLF